MRRPVVLFIFGLLIFPAIPVAAAAVRSVFQGIPARGAQKPGRTPSQVLKAFYTWYLYQMDEEKDPFTTGRATLRKYLTRRLIKQIENDQVDHAGVDVFTQSDTFSEGWVEMLVISDVKVHGTHATAAVQFGKSGEPTIAITLIKQGTSWKIDKVRNGTKKVR